MKINPSFALQTNNAYTNNKKLQNIQKEQSNTQNKISNNLLFTSLYADARGENQNAYGIYTMHNSGFAKVKRCATRIFRELPSQIAISKLLDPDKKTQINILGCSDGSEAYAYAIVMKEAMGDKAQENIKIKAVDFAPYMVDIAKTGAIVCSDIEKKYANGNYDRTGSSSPLRGEGWDKYLTKSERPEGFEQALEKYPFLQYVECDPVARKTIGNGLEWYEINKEGLPEIEFKQGDMRNHTFSNDEVEAEVYVIANSGAYLAESNPDDYIKLFEDIKNANKGKGKDVYVVIGDVELSLTNPAMSRLLGIRPGTQNRIKHSITDLGFEKVSDTKLRKKGVEHYKDAANKIYKLKA